MSTIRQGKLASNSRLVWAALSLMLFAGSPQAGTPVEAVTVQRQVIRVGAERPVKTIAEAARIAKNGDTVEVDAGDYIGDVAVWSQSNLALRAIGGRARLIANGEAVEGKGIWVIRGNEVSVEGFEFSGATVPDHNGAGIRFEKGSLTIRDCAFLDNENGILTSNNPELVLTIENSEFALNGYGDGYTHNLYVGAIASLSVTGSYFHHARVGHLLKSRAAVNHIYYNRLTDEAGGKASYELEFPSGGVAYVIGNIIQQSVGTENPHMVSFGAENYKWPRNELYLVNNTLVDNSPQGGVFLHIKPGDVKVKVVNNLLAGRGKLDTAGPGQYQNNFKVDRREFVLADGEDYRLKQNSRLLGRAVDAGSANGLSLMPDREYRHPRMTAQLHGLPRHPGALQSLQ